MRTPSPTLVVSTVALVVAVGGAGYAVTALPRDSVGTAQVKKNAITSPKIRNGAVQLADLAPAVRARLSSAGPAGPAGATGATGPAGPTASFAVSADPGADVPIGGGTQVLSTTFTAPFAGRLIVTSAVSIGQSTAGTAITSCWIRVSRNGDVVASSRLITVSTAAATDDVAVPVTSGVTLPSAGAYDVATYCAKSGSATVGFDLGEMTGILTAA